MSEQKNPNKNGKYQKQWVLENGYEIFEKDYVPEGVNPEEWNIEYWTASTLEKSGYKIPKEKRLEWCIGFATGPGWRGYAPIYDIFDIAQRKQRGEF